MKKYAALILAVLLLAAFAACGAKTPEADPAPEATPVPKTEPTPEPTPEPAPESRIDLPDGMYLAEFKTDNSMFHVNEANKGLGVLTVENGRATIHVSLVSKSILNLYPGLAEDAQKDGAVLLEPTLDSVTYDDGITEEVYGFDIPVPVIGEEFDLALIGKKGVWYDHKVSVQNPVPMTEE